MKRRILIGAVGLIKGRVRNIGPTMVQVCDELEPFLNESGWFGSAPFQSISLILRLGQSDLPSVEIGRIDTSHQELQLAAQLDMKRLQLLLPAALHIEVRSVAVQALAATAERFGLQSIRLPA